jgi:SAM-dependent methyltransferase
VSYWNDLDRHLDLSDNWMAHPLVRARLNRRVSGDEAVWPLEWLASSGLVSLPLTRAASIGCGVGNLERDLASKSIVERITGVDLSPNCTAEATRLAGEAGLGARLDYFTGSAEEFLASSDSLDAIFFHSSLHHIADVPHFLDLVRARLRPGGVLYIDEYVGPSRHQWQMRHRLWWNAIYYSLPSTVRRVRRIRAPINREDPTEAIDSGRIVPMIAEKFEIVARRDYGGTLLSVLYPNLRQPGPDESPRPFNDTVAYLLDLEEAWLAHPDIAPEPSYYTVMVARKRV